MAEHPVKAVLTDGAAPNKAAMRSYLMARHPLVLATATEIQSTAVDGSTIVIVATTGQVYRYDSEDTTSAHDGLLVLVGSAGKRFKSAAVYAPRAGVYLNVVSRTLTAPPGAPDEGAVYIVGAAATGAWATHDNKVAIRASGVWYFETPQPGALAWVN